MEPEEPTSRTLHPWHSPQPLCSTTEMLESAYPLMVFNSLTRTKVRFIPRDPKTVTWYQCGPTVYAESHMGHARTYLGLDIINRIMKDYLGYNLVVCQNVTDIDDKIIIRSSERQIPFRELASKYEAEFAEDMASLGVATPSVSTRVSEYVPEIISYIDTLISKGTAYESNGSVYFSVSAFEAQGHTYGKLMPEQIGNSELLAEGEGALSASTEKPASDFVLWKKTKDQAGVLEPSWESPWGPGRPGWHIECSVMSHFALQKFGGGTLDIHAGGVDLKFPHHENEIAQSEAYSGSHQWVNYWLHTGHLNIKGFKMSKSLKNFITIRAALELNTARQIRFCFLMHKYNSPMDYGDSTMSQAMTAERTFAEYFHNVKAVLRRLGNIADTVQHVGMAEEALMVSLEASKGLVRAALLDDFDTPTAIVRLGDLVKECNRYMEGVATPISSSTAPTAYPPNGLSSVLLTSVARYVTSVLRTFGLTPTTDIGFPMGGGEESQESQLSPYLDAITAFRMQVRAAAMAGDAKAVLALTDKLRDDVLPDLGVRMEDKGSGADMTSVWKLDDPAAMRMERLQKDAAKAEKEKQKEEARKKALEREEKARIPPQMMFKMGDFLAQFGEWDEQGLPTKDKVGEALSKGVLKKLGKEWEKQREAYEKLMARDS